MEISSILIGMLLFIASVVFVCLPFQKKRLVSVKKSTTQAAYNGSREVVLSALRDLDFDFKTGKVSEDDYTPLRAQLLSEAARYIEQEQESEKKLEELIQSRRTAQRWASSCEHCGAPMQVGQRFCAKCGLAVTQAACPSCGKKIRASDQFCSSCGTRLEVQIEAVSS